MRRDGLVWVVSTVSRVSPSITSEASSGGFDWYDDEDKAVAAYVDEVLASTGKDNARIRLVRYEFPTYGLAWTNESITALLDSDTDGIEHLLPVIAETTTWKEVAR